MTFKLTFFCLTVFILVTWARPRVTVNKCCSKGEFMSRDTNYTCVQGGHDNFYPTIFSRKSKGYLPAGKIPDHWDLVTKVPDCPPYHRLTPFYQLPLVIVENGSLFMTTLSGSFADPKLFCYDYKMTLVCIEEPREMKKANHVKKCCGRNAIFTSTKNSCMTFNGTDYKISLSGGFTLAEGFPSCEGGMAITGIFKEKDLLNNGSLVTAQATLPRDAFCLEHVLESKGEISSVSSKGLLGKLELCALT